MSRDLDELNYLADLEDDDNFEPSDYNTQDMRNINEKVNRILYGKNEEQPKNEKSEKKEPDQVDISKKATKPEHKEEKKPEYKEKKVEHKEKKENKKQEEKKETKPSNSNPTEELVDITKDPEMVDDVKEEAKKPKNKKAIVGFIIGVAVVLCVVLVFVVQGVVSPSNNNAQQETTTSETKPTVAITNDKGEFVFAKGTKVSGVDIGGLTVVQARILLKSEEIKSRPKMNITVNVDGEETTYTEDDFTFKYDTSTVLDDEKIISKRMADGTTYPTTTDSNGNEYAKEQVMKISASLNQSSVDKLINKIYKKYNVKAKDARVTKFKPDSSPMFTYEEGKFQCTYIIPAGLKAFNLLYSLELQLFQRGLGSPLFTHTDLLYRFLDCPNQRFILAPLRPQNFLLYDGDIDHMKVIMVYVLAQRVGHGAVALVGVHDRRKDILLADDDFDCGFVCVGVK